MSINYEAIIRSAMEQGVDLDTIMEDFTREANKILAEDPKSGARNKSEGQPRPQESRGAMSKIGRAINKGATEVARMAAEAAMKQEEEEKRKAEEEALKAKWKPYTYTIKSNAGRDLPSGRSEYMHPAECYLDTNLSADDIANLLCYYVCQNSPRYARLCGELDVDIYQIMTEIVSTIDGMVEAVENGEEDCLDWMAFILPSILASRGYDCEMRHESSEDADTIEVEIAPKESAASSKDGSYRIKRPVRTYGSFMDELIRLSEDLECLWG